MTNMTNNIIKKLQELAKAGANEVEMAEDITPMVFDTGDELDFAEKMVAIHGWNTEFAHFLLTWFIEGAPNRKDINLGVAIANMLFPEE